MLRLTKASSVKYGLPVQVGQIQSERVYMKIMLRASVSFLALVWLAVLSGPAWCVTPADTGTDSAPAVVKSKGNDVSYFRHVVISGNGWPTGRYPISESESRQTRNSKFVFNGGILAGIEFFDGYGNRTSAEEYIYDGQGRMVESRTFGYNGAFLGVYRHLYNEKGVRIETRFLGTNDTRQNDVAGIAAWQFEFDKDGKRAVTKMFDAGGNLLGRKQIKYDEKGLKTETEFTEEQAKNSGDIAITKYRHDRFGKNIEESTHKSDGTMVNRFVYAHDNKGYLASMDSYDSGGRLIGRAGYKYNSHGDQVENRMLGPDGKVLGLIQYRYSDQGNMIEQSTFGADEKPLSAGISSLKFEYDDKGNLVRESSYGADGKLVNDENGIAVYHYKFDDRQNLVEEEFHAADGTPLKEGIAFNRFKYDERDRVAEESYFNARNGPAMDVSGVARRVYAYAENGDTVTVTEFDASMNIIKD